MNVSKHMTARPITVSEDTDFKEAMSLMQRHSIRRLPVVDASGALAGIVAERDLVVAADRFLNSPVEVARIMTRRVFTIGDKAPVVDAASLLIQRKIGGLPVTGAGGKLLGIITETDLLKALTALLRQGERKLSAAPGRTPKAKPRARRKPVKKEGKAAGRVAKQTKLVKQRRGPGRKASAKVISRKR